MTDSQSFANTPLSRDVFDVVIIGAGVVGCAMARRFVLAGAQVAVVEKASDILDGASKANSAILHTGFDAPGDSLELQCIRDGYREYVDIHKQLGLPLEKTGAHVVAWNEGQETGLAAILKKAHENGIEDCRLINANELQKAEPSLAEHAKAAISVPGEAIIDPWSAPYAYLKQALLNGAEVFLSCEVLGGALEDGEWQLQTERGTLSGKTVINCAGLYGDLVNEKLLGETGFHITPRKGQFVVFDKAAFSLVNSVILPVPGERTKGVVLFQTIFGNLAVGPTAEDQQSRKDASTNREALEMLLASAVEKIPALKDMPVTATYAGLRPASEFKDYQIDFNTKMQWITVGGIRSTGLSGALGIARHAFGLYGKNHHQQIENREVPPASVLIQNSSGGLKRDWQHDQPGEIVCHCELVTRREIERALEGPLAARSLAGLKRQTRATMGRCQGFYCSSRLAELTSDHLEPPLARKICHD